jgi:hypothetical protein
MWTVIYRDVPIHGGDGDGCRIQWVSGSSTMATSLLAAKRIITRRLKSLNAAISSRRFGNEPYEHETE